jgi:hypothetical protein
MQLSYFCPSLPKLEQEHRRSRDTYTTGVIHTMLKGVKFYFYRFSVVYFLFRAMIDGTV